QELVRGDALKKTAIGLDFFDASINRIAAWVIGTRSAQKSLLYALLEPNAMLKKFELDADFTSRLALMEDAKTLPFGAVYDYFCLKNDITPGNAFMNDIKQYESDVLALR
ncbi:L-rhamnose isomerase, partial [bacterium]|nr:L-rhamnose isomerase [bacterium]